MPRFAGHRECLAEREGFEPPDPCRSTVFKTAAIDHSAIFPGAKLQLFLIPQIFYFMRFGKTIAVADVPELSL